MSRLKHKGVRRTPAGTWCVDYRDPLGVQRRQTFDTYDKALEFYERRKVKVRDGDFFISRMTLKEGAAKFLAEKANRRYQTVLQLKGHIENYIVPSLGDLIMAKITFEDVEKAGDSWEQDIGPETINKIYGTLGAIYKAMWRHGVKKNPMPYVRRKERPAVELDEDDEANELRSIQPDEVYSADELRRLIEHSEPGRERALHMTACLTGMRHGELNSLQWTRLDLGNNKIIVRRSLTERPKKAGGAVLEPPKTKSAYREIPIPAVLVAELKRWKLQCPASELDLVFPNVLGKPASRKSNNRFLAAAMKRAEIRGLSMNNLRHSFASQNLAAGVPALEVSQLMGHKDLSTTLKVYARWAKRETSTAAAKLASRIFVVK